MENDVYNYTPAKQKLSLQSIIPGNGEPLWFGNQRYHQVWITPHPTSNAAAKEKWGFLKGSLFGPQSLSLQHQSLLQIQLKPVWITFWSCWGSAMLDFSAGLACDFSQTLVPFDLHQPPATLPHNNSNPLQDMHIYLQFYPEKSHYIKLSFKSTHSPSPSRFSTGVRG